MRPVNSFPAYAFTGAYNVNRAYVASAAYSSIFGDGSADP